MKKTKIFGIELPPEAQAAYDHVNAVPAGRFERKRSSAKVVASAATPTASTTPVQPVVEAARWNRAVKRKHLHDSAFANKREN
jgi:hypothetical protein